MTQKKAELYAGIGNVPNTAWTVWIVSWEVGEFPCKFGVLSLDGNCSRKANAQDDVAAMVTFLFMTAEGGGERRCSFE